jgi:CPA2 family monovalent cation:H+ antiporter-2
MLEMMLLLIAASVGLGLSAKFRVPSIPLMILGGVALGVTGWMGETGDLQNTLLLGLTFLLFIVGAELDLTAVGERKRAAIVFGLVQFALLGAISLGAAMWMGFGLRAGLYIGLAIASSSTLVVVTLLRGREQYFESFGRLAIGVVLLQDLLVILLLPVLLAESYGQMGRGVGGTVALVALAWACARWLVPMLMLRLERDEESLLLVMLATLFAFVGLAYWLGVPPMSGAFLAGIALSRFPVSGLVRGQMASLSDFFLAVFFVSLGVLLVMLAPLIDVEQVLFHGVVLASILLLTPFMLVPLARRFGLTTRSSIEMTNLLAQCGELSLVVVLLGFDQGHLDASAVSAIVVLAVITMVVSPILSSEAVTWRVMHVLPGSRSVGEPVSYTGHLVFLGCGTSTRKLILRAVEAGHTVVAVDDDSAVVELLRNSGVEAIRGDGADPWLLRRLGIRNAKVVVSTMRRKRDHERLLRLAGDTRVIVRTFEPATADALRSQGATVVVESLAASDRFMEWFGQRDEASAV